MRAAVLTGPNRIELIEQKTPEPGPGEVRIKVHTAAICGTDVHIFQGFPVGTYQPKLPMILGHEASATVTAVGKGVTSIREGQRCVVEANIGCGVCDICRKGSYCFCDSVKIISIHGDGIFAEYSVLPECAVHPIPDSYHWEAASLTEPLAMTMLTFFDCPVTPGDYVAVLGAGMGGYGLAALARMSGAEKVILTGTRPERLAIGKQVGADVVINAREEDVVTRIFEETGGHGADVVYEAAGTAETIVQTVGAAAKTGKIGIYGVPVSKVDGFDFAEMLLKGLKVICASGSPRAFPSAISVAAAGRVDISPVITHRFSFDRIQEAIELVRDRNGGVVKAVVKIQAD